MTERELSVARLTATPVLLRGSGSIQTRYNCQGFLG